MSSTLPTCRICEQTYHRPAGVPANNSLCDRCRPHPEVESARPPFTEARCFLCQDEPANTDMTFGVIVEPIQRAPFKGEIGLLSKIDQRALREIHVGTNCALKLHGMAGRRS